MDKNCWPPLSNLEDDRPLYKQLHQIILDNIQSGKLKAGDMLPSEKALCEMYGLSRSTVRGTLGSLEEQGLLLRRRGLGSYIAEPKVRRTLDDMYSFTSQMHKMGYNTSSKVLYFSQIVVNEKQSKKTGMEEGTEVLCVRRLRLADKLPMLLETTYIVKSYCPKLTESDLENSSLYQLLSGAGLVMGRAVESYEPVAMDKKTRKLLCCENNDMAFRIRRRSYTSDDVLFEYTESIMPGQRSQLEVTLRSDSVTLKKDYY